MKSEGKRRFSLSAMRLSDRIILGVLTGLVAVLIVLTVMQRCGLSLINGGLMLHLPFVALFVLVGWGGYALLRRLKNRIVKVVLSSVLVLAMTVGVLWVFTALSSMIYFVVPQRYATLTSPSGAHKLVVFRTFDIDQERVEARKAARLEANPDGSDQLQASDTCQLYAAYPQALGVFYRSNADVEGELRLAWSDPSAQTDDGEALPGGTLMVEWLDDESTAHFFVENPGVGEGGELYVRF